MRFWYLSHRRPAKGQASLRQSLHCSHTWIMEVDDGSDQKSDIYPHWMAAHAWLKNDETCHNLMSWFIYSCIDVAACLTVSVNWKSIWSVILAFAVGHFITWLIACLQRFIIRLQFTAFMDNLLVLLYILWVYWAVPGFPRIMLVFWSYFFKTLWNVSRYTDE